jgi:hypothetical protein
MDLDLFGNPVVEKKERPAAKAHEFCKHVTKFPGRNGVACEKRLVTEQEKERGLCEDHQRGEDVRKAKASWYGLRR